MTIGRAILLPGQELMERMDKEYNRSGGQKYRAEEEEQLRREEKESQSESKGEGQDPAQNHETREKMPQDVIEETNTQTI